MLIRGSKGRFCSCAVRLCRLWRSAARSVAIVRPCGGRRSTAPSTVCRHQPGPRRRRDTERIGDDGRDFIELVESRATVVEVTAGRRSTESPTGRVARRTVAESGTIARGRYYLVQRGRSDTAWHCERPQNGGSGNMRCQTRHAGRSRSSSSTTSRLDGLARQRRATDRLRPRRLRERELLRDGSGAARRIRPPRDPPRRASNGCAGHGRTTRTDFTDGSRTSRQLGIGADSRRRRGAVRRRRRRRRTDAADVADERERHGHVFSEAVGRDREPRSRSRARRAAAHRATVDAAVRRRYTLDPRRDFASTRRAR